MQEREVDVEYVHTLEELLEPFAAKDSKTIEAFLTTTKEHLVPRLSFWGLAALYLCDPEKYPEVNDVPEIRKLRKEGLTEKDKRHLFDQKAINEITDLASQESETEFSLVHSDEDLGVKDTDLRRINKESNALTKFRQELRLKKGAGPSIGEVPGESSV